jgi:hypothetical protein
LKNKHYISLLILDISIMDKPPKYPNNIESIKTIDELAISSSDNIMKKYEELMKNAIQQSILDNKTNIENDIKEQVKESIRKYYLGDPILAERDEYFYNDEHNEIKAKQKYMINKNIDNGNKHIYETQFIEEWNRHKSSCPVCSYYQKINIPNGEYCVLYFLTTNNKPSAVIYYILTNKGKLISIVTANNGQILNNDNHHVNDYNFNITKFIVILIKYIFNDIGIYDRDDKPNSTPKKVQLIKFIINIYKDIVELRIMFTGDIY